MKVELWNRFLHSKLRDYFISFVSGKSKLNTNRKLLQSQKSILVYLLERMGDIVVSTAVISAIRDKYPDAFITYATKREYSEILTGNPDIDEIYYAHNFMDINRLVRDRKFDIIIPLHIVDEKGWPYFSNITSVARPKIKKHGYWWTWGKPLLDLYAENAGVRLINRQSFIDIPDSIMEESQKILRRYGINNEDYLISFHTHSSMRERNWPIEKFTELAKSLLNTFRDIKIIVLGGKGEYLPCKGVINLAGKLSLKHVFCNY